MNLPKTLVTAALLAVGGLAAATPAHAAVSQFEPWAEAARAPRGGHDVFTDGARGTGERDAFTDGARGTGERDTFTDGARGIRERDSFRDGA